MTDSNPSLLGRISLAFGTFFAIIGDAELAAGVRRLRAGAPEPQPAPAAEPEPAVAVVAPAVSTLHQTSPESALQLLGLLQREARLVDFVEEDITAYSDADIGAAARLVHEGCRKTLREHFSLQPVRAENEGERITLAAGFDAAAIRLSGNVVGQPPFSGQLTHRGWRVSDTRLPSLSDSHDASIIAPAEVEL
ncbi:MAG: DUF2760 domain-containing protein [Azoarcus sp. PHD]|jgi:hypothetical protein|nr:MAG: DUF2760 domain-containing protein [Azoarcus sp. PHD]